jgi:hypothetical protein
MTDTPPAATPSPDTAGTKACRLCAGEINSSARKCIHCTAYQDWRAGLGFSATILSLLIALISVATALLPVIKTTFFEVKNSQITISPQRFARNELSAFISNVGTRPGVIGSSGIVEVTTKSGVSHIYHFDALTMPDVVVVPQGTSVLMKFMWSNADRPEISSNNRSCYLTVSVTSFDGVDSFPRIPFSCAKLPLGTHKPS